MSTPQVQKGLQFRWEFRPQSTPPEELTESLKISPILARILSARSMTKEEALTFLDPSINRLGPPERLPDGEQAVRRLSKALKNGERTMVHGDYDVDGLTSLALLTRNLERLGARKVIPYVPSRFVEGYGLSSKAIESADAEGVSLIVTVDCGITAFQETRLAKEKGIDIIITDHHEPLAELPEAVAIMDPKRSEDAPDELAGVGVGFRLLELLYRTLERDMKPLLWDLDLVALGTIADQAPLVGENRVLASLGLKTLDKTLKVGLKALKRISGLGEGIKTGDILFMLAPRLNAAGRLTHAKNALKLLLTRDSKEAMELAHSLDIQNRERQQLEERILEEARELAEKERGSYVLVLAKEGWNEGVIGIVASRIAEEFYRPTFLIALEEEYGKGSGRSIPSFDLFHALLLTEEHLEAYGGHKMAAGLRIKRDKIDLFRDAINKVAEETLREEELQPQIKIDTKISLGEVTEDFFEDMRRLSPFGVGNPLPVFLAENVEVVGDPRTVGNHLRFSLRDETGHASAIFFRGGEYVSSIKRGETRMDAVFHLKEDSYAARPILELSILDFRFRE